MSLLEQKIATQTALQQLQSAEVVTISKHQLLRISTQSIVLKVASGAEILRLWVQKFLQVHGTQLCQEEWLELTGRLEGAFLDLLSALHPEEELLNSELNIWLHYVVEYVKQLEGLMPSVDLGSIFILLSFALSIVKAVLHCYQERNKSDVLHNYFQSIIDVYHIVLNFVNENLQNINLASKSDFCSLTKLILVICDCVSCTLLDIKTVIETWKNITKLIGYCAKWSQASGSWVERPVSILLKEILRNVNVVTRENTLQQPLEQVEKYLKVTNFYLKVLQRLTNDFKHENFPCAEIFLNVFEGIKHVSESLINIDISKLIDKYVQASLNEIFEIIFKHRDISSTLFSYLQSEIHWKVRFDIVEAYILASLKDGNGKWVDNNVDLFIAAFERFFKDSKLYNDPVRYDSILELYAALAILCATPKLKKYFRSSVFSGNVCKAHASTEILLVIAHYSVAESPSNAEVLLAEFNFWRQCSKSFAFFSHNTARFFVNELLGQLLQLCQRHLQMPPLWEPQKVTELSLENCVLWHGMGLDVVLPDEHQQQKFYTQLKDELVLLLKKNEEHSQPEDYYKMVINIEILSSGNVLINFDLLSHIFEIFQRIYNNTSDQMRTFELFINAACKLAATFVKRNAISPALLEQMLVCLQQDKHTTLGSLLFLDACCQHQQDSIRTTANHLLAEKLQKQNEPSCQALLIPALMAKYHDCDVDATVLESISPLIVNTPRAHSCDKLCGNKRPRLNSTSQEEDLKFVLHELSRRSQQVLDLISNFDSEDYKALQNIVNNLSSVLVDKK